MAKKIHVLEELNSTTYRFKIGEEKNVQGQDRDYRDDVIIGGDNPSVFEPKIKLTRWKWGRKPITLDIEFKPSDNKVKTYKTDKEKVKWESADSSFDVYGKEPHINPNRMTGRRGELEIELILKKKPDSNIFEWIVNAPNTEWTYQPELTQFEIDRGAIRKENVIGSYAVYHITDCDAHKDPNTTPDNVKLFGMRSKAFHVFRPEAIDDNGVRVWCNLDYDNEILSVTVPQDFLDNASYPVIIDPTFGYTTEGASTYNLEDAIFAVLATGAAGTLDSISAFIQEEGGGAHTGKGVLYLVSDSSLVAASDEDTTFPPEGTPAWNVFSVSGAPAVSAVSYAVGAWFDSGTGGILIHYDAGGGPGMKYQIGVVYTDLSGVPPDPATFTDDAISPSVYATYTVGGATTPASYISMII